MSLHRVFNLSGLGVAALLVFPGGAWAATDDLSAAVKAVFDRSAPAVVKIQAEDNNGPLSGTGFFIDPNGTIYTNYSVGGESHDIVISYGTARCPATRIAADERSGLAILKIEAEKTPFLPLGKASSLGIASLVMTIGYPLDLPVTPNVGCVGGYGISDGNRYFAVSHIRANVPAQRGEGGAPLLNMNGEVVGILESSAAGGAGCFALPIEAAEKVQGDVVRYGEARAGWLGIRFDKSDTTANQIEVQGFVDDSPAQNSGIQPGDIIIQVGDRKISSLEDVLNAAFYLTAGEEVPLTISRSDPAMDTAEIKVVKVVPAPNPLAPRQEAMPMTGFTFSVRLGNAK